MIITVCAARRLEAAVAGGPCDVLSLISPDTTAPSRPAGAGAWLTLRFNDIDGPRPELAAPSPQIIGQILAFGRRPRSRLVIHCHAAVSRSTAAAYMLACQALPTDAEAGLARRLRGLSPTATPNRLMVALADDVLGRKGRMTRAIAAIGRGAEAFEGAAFTWRIGEDGLA